MYQPRLPALLPRWVRPPTPRILLSSFIFLGGLSSLVSAAPVGGEGRSPSPAAASSPTPTPSPTPSENPSEAGSGSEGQRAEAATGRPSGAGGVAGQIAGRQWLIAEVDRQISAQLSAARLEFERRRYALRSQALRGMIDQALLEQALAAEPQERAAGGINGLLEREVFQGISPPSEAEQRAFFEEHQGQLPGTFESLQERIQSFMMDQQRQRALSAYLDQLRRRFGAQEFLEPPRVSLSSEGFSKGPADAPITIVEFADFECGFCSRAGSVLDQVVARFPGKIRIVYRDFPLSFHPNAKPAAIAARCAGAQGKFWEMHDALFAQQGGLGEALYLSEARRLGLDLEPFESCLRTPATGAAVDQDFREGQQVGVSGTPAFFINGIELSGAQPPEAFEEIIRRELAASRRE